jgi:hypothetical protein
MTADNVLEPTLVKWALAATAGVVAVAILGFTIIGAIAFGRAPKGTAVSFGLMFQRGNLLRVITAVLVIEAAVVLSLVGALTQGATAILSAVAGFVLGGLDRGHGEARGRTEAEPDIAEER